MDTATAAASEVDLFASAAKRKCRSRLTFPGPRLIIGVAASFLIALSISPTGSHQLQLSLTRLPTPYTEFFFIDPTGLPVAMTSNSTQSVPALIRNHEGKTVSYHYITTSNGPAGMTTTDGRVQVGNDKSAIVSAQANVGQTGEYQVTIQLEGRPVALAFRIRVKG